MLSKLVLRNASAHCAGGDVRRETRLYMLKIPRFKLFAQASQSTWAVGLCSVSARTDLQGDVPATGFQWLCVFRVKVGLFPTNGDSGVGGNFPKGDPHQGACSRAGVTAAASQRGST